MNDLIQRLREHDDPRLYHEADALMSEAANRIADLEIECQTLRHGKRLADQRIIEMEQREPIAWIALGVPSLKPAWITMDKEELDAACLNPKHIVPLYAETKL